MMKSRKTLNHLLLVFGTIRKPDLHLLALIKKLYCMEMDAESFFIMVLSLHRSTADLKYEAL